MKHRHILLACTLLVSLFSACDKFSFREDYTGNFDFNTIRKTVGAAVPDSTNTNYPGYVTKWEKEAVLIRFSETDSLAPRISETGVLTVVAFVAGGTFSGEFSDVNNVHFESAFRSFTGDSVAYSVTGVRR